MKILFCYGWDARMRGKRISQLTSSFTQRKSVYRSSYSIWCRCEMNEWMTIWPTNEVYVTTLWMWIPHWGRKCISVKQTNYPNNAKEDSAPKVQRRGGKTNWKNTHLSFYLHIIHNSINTVDSHLLRYCNYWRYCFIATSLDFFLYQKYICIYYILVCVSLLPFWKQMAVILTIVSEFHTL